VQRQPSWRCHWRARWHPSPCRLFIDRLPDLVFLSVVGGFGRSVLAVIGLGGHIVLCVGRLGGSGLVLCVSRLIFIIVVGCALSGRGFLLVLVLLGSGILRRLLVVILVILVDPLAGGLVDIRVLRCSRCYQRVHRE
jgi:hypothetical protein